MDDNTLSYLNKQFIRVAPLPIINGDNGQFKAQFFSGKGKTNVLNITPQQFRHIEQYLSGVPLNQIGD